MSQNVLVVGLGESGVCAANLLLYKGFSVYLYDDNEENFQSQEILLLIQTGCKKIENNEIEHLNLSFAVVSPGVDSGHKIVQQCFQLHIKVMSELELGYLYCKNKIIAITGTNGKSTTTSLIGKILKQAKMNCAVCGNIGNAFCGEVLKRLKKPQKDFYYVVEVSSYQLEFCETFKPNVAVLTNITSDHLKRHKTLKNYIETKLKMFKNITEKDNAVINFDDATSKKIILRVPCPFCGFSTKARGRCMIKKGYFIYDGEPICSTEVLKIPGNHNLSNALAAISATKALSVSNVDIEKALRSFQGIPHRLEYFKTLHGVKIYNDSKATNIDSALTAVKAVKESTVLILGGSDKGENFKLFFGKLPKTVRLCVLTGATAQKIAIGAKDAGFENIMTADDFEQAVLLAINNCKRGETLLFSPACASFDRFKNFEERGKRFVEIIKAIKK